MRARRVRTQNRVYNESMRITIEIDEELIAKAQKLGGFTSPEESAEAALRAYVERLDPQPKRPGGGQGLLDLAGKIDMAPMSDIRPGWQPSARRRQ